MGAMNRFKTGVLLLVLGGLLWATCMLLADDGFWVGLIVALGMNAVAFFLSDELALSVSGAQPASEQHHPDLFAIVRNLAAQQNMPMPQLCVMDSAQPNAFATGRNPQRGVIVVTQGLLETLDNSELEGVLGHELAHIRNRDILVATVAAMLATALIVVGRIGLHSSISEPKKYHPGIVVFAVVGVVLIPLATVILRMAISRTREYMADETGAEITGNPLALASALSKIETASAGTPMKVGEAYSHLYIANPLESGTTKKPWFFMSTHPPIEDRIARLKQTMTPIS